MADLFSSPLIMIALVALGFVLIFAGITGRPVQMGEIQIAPAKSRYFRILYSIFGFLIISLPVIIAFISTPDDALQASILWIVSGLLAALVLIVVKSNLAEQIKEANEKIEEAESKMEKEPQKARPAWDLARITLDAYFNRNLAQITSIFWLSVVVLMIGFGIIVWGIAQAMKSPTAIAPAAIASIAGVITEFIGATFFADISLNHPAGYELFKNVGKNQFCGHGNANS